MTAVYRIGPTLPSCFLTRLFHRPRYRKVVFRCGNRIAEKVSRPVLVKLITDVADVWFVAQQGLVFVSVTEQLRAQEKVLHRLTVSQACCIDFGTS